MGAIGPVRLKFKPPLTLENSRRTASPYKVPLRFVGPSLANNPDELSHARTALSSALHPYASGYPPRHPVDAKSMAFQEENSRGVTNYDNMRQNPPKEEDFRVPQVTELLRTNGRRSNGLEAPATTMNAQESHGKNITYSERLDGASKARANGEPLQSDIKANAVDRNQTISDAINARGRAEEEAATRRIEENARQGRLRRDAQQGTHVLKPPPDRAQALAEQPQDGFERHVCFISEWLQSDSYGSHHTFPTDGQAIYTREIKPRIHRIRWGALSQNATFAVQYVGLMALTHVLRLIYVHRGSRIGGEILRCYDADARLKKVDDITSAILEIFESIDDNEKEWLKARRGAASVLMQEMLEVWPMVCAAGPIQLQQNLSGVLWTSFRHKIVPGFPAF